VSLSEQVDTSTPTGKMVFTVLGAVAELERSLIVERVKAGLRNARAKGKRLGRPPKELDTEAIAALRRKGLGWRAIAKQLGGWCRNCVSRRPRVFQNSGKGFWNAVGGSLRCFRTSFRLGLFILTMVDRCHNVAPRTAKRTPATSHNFWGSRGVSCPLPSASSLPGNRRRMRRQKETQCVPRLLFAHCFCW
jgi:hypothetical protein